MKIAIGLVLAFVIGVICRVADIPVPAPPALIGALLVVSMTSGFLIMDRHLARIAVTTDDKS